MHGYTSYCAPTPLQEGAAAALESEVAGSASFDGVGELMAAHWHLLAAALRATGVEVCPASGGYFLVADVRATGMSDLEYVTWLATCHGVAAVPLSVFFCSEAPRSRAMPTSMDSPHAAPPLDLSTSLSLDTHACRAQDRPTSLVRFAVCKERPTIDQAVFKITRATVADARAYAAAGK